MSAACLANIFWYINLANILGSTFLTTAYLATILYVAIRIADGLIIIVLQVGPLASLRVVQLHGPMLQRRMCNAVEFLAFVLWLNLMLNYLGLRAQLIENIEAVICRDTFQKFDHTLRSRATKHGDGHFDGAVLVRKGPVCYLAGDERPVRHDHFGTVWRANNACTDTDASHLSNAPGVAKDPAPQAYVVNFASGVVTFQLRAWTDRYEDWVQLRSDLAVAVDDALTREKIGIP